jgi:hypothetical protein
VAQILAGIAFHKIELPPDLFHPAIIVGIFLPWDFMGHVGFHPLFINSLAQRPMPGGLIKDRENIKFPSPVNPVRPVHPVTKDKEVFHP